MGSGESGPMDLGGAKRSRSPSAASPVAFCLLCRHGQSRSPPAGGEIPLRKEPSSGPMRASGPTKKRSIIAPSSAPFGGTFPIPSGLRPSPLDKGSRPPRGRLLGEIAPSSVTASPCHLPPRGKAFEGERPTSRGRALGAAAPYGLCCVSRSRENPQSWKRRSTETQKVTASSKTTRPMA